MPSVECRCDAMLIPKKLRKVSGNVFFCRGCFLIQCYRIVTVNICLPASSYLHGTTIPVDGGMTIRHT